MFKKYRQLVIGIILGALLFSGVSVAASNGLKSISVMYNNIKIAVNGKEVKTDSEPFIYEGRTYVPIRVVSEALGAEVGWNDKTKTVEISSSVITAITSNGKKPEEPTILTEGFHTSGDMTGYAVGFSDGFMVMLFNEKGTLPMSTYEYVAVSIMSEDENMKTNINTPTLIGFSEVSGERYYPVSFTTYGRDIPEQYKASFESNDFFKQFEKKDGQSSFTGMVYYDSFVMLDGIHYDDGIHKCTLYLKDKVR